MTIGLIVYSLFFAVWLLGSFVGIWHLRVHYEPYSKMRQGLGTYIWLSLATILATFTTLLFSTLE